MFKLLQKKLNKKGFTLAELLVVIAILAVLIAIAIPVFTGMVADARLRVNQANIRSARSAAVAKILTNLHEQDDSTPKQNMNAGTQEGYGWVALAKVDNAGDISDLEVYVAPSIDTYPNGIFIGDSGTAYEYMADGKHNTYVINGLDVDKVNGKAYQGGKFYISTGEETTSSGLAGISPTSGSTTATKINYYVVQCVIDDIDIDNTPDPSGSGD